MNTIKLYSGNWNFETVETELNISPDYAQMQLAKFHDTPAYDPMCVLWAEITVGGEKRTFALDYERVILKEYKDGRVKK